MHLSVRRPVVGVAGRRVRRGWWFRSSPWPGRCGFRRCARTASASRRPRGWTIPQRSASRSLVRDRSAAAARWPAEAPGCWRRRIVRPGHPRVSSIANAEPRRSLRRYAMAACAAASTAATRSPMRSKSSDTEANSAASPSRSASANRAARPTRGPSTIDSSSRNRGAPERSPNWVAVCRQSTSNANCPLAAALSAADNTTVIASLTAPWPAATQARATLRS